MGTCSCDNNQNSIIKCSASGPLLNKIVNCDCEDQEQIIIKGVCSRTKIESLLVAGENLWTQLFVPEVLCVPERKPDIEQLISITSMVEIISQRVVKTPVYKVLDVDTPIQNQEGIFTTGRKLVIEGVLHQKVVYTAAVESQSVHTAEFDVPFSAFIILEAGTKLTTKYAVDACIEDVFVCDLNNRQIFKNVTLFLKATALVCS